MFHFCAETESECSIFFVDDLSLKISNKFIKFARYRDYLLPFLSSFQFLGRCFTFVNLRTLVQLFSFFVLCCVPLTIHQVLTYSFRFCSLPICPKIVPTGQPDDFKPMKKTCLKKCFDPRCEERNSLQSCDGIVSCYWCRKSEYGIPLDKAYCASSERCFRGKESTAKQSDGKVISQSLVNAYACFIAIVLLKFFT